MSLVDLEKTTPWEACEAIDEADKEYKRAYLERWKVNIRRLAGEYETDLAQEDSVYGRVGSRKYRYDKSPLLYAVIPLANPKMHFACARQVRTALNFSALPASSRRSDRLRATATTRMLKARLAEKGGQDYEEAYAAALTLKCATPVFMLVEGDTTKPRPKMLDSTEDDTGDVVVKCLPPWRVAWEPGLNAIDKWTWCKTTEYLSPQEIIRRWPGPDNAEILSDESILDELPESDPLRCLEKGIKYSLVKVERIWIIPHGSFPNGAQRIVIGRKYYKKTYKVKPGDEQPEKKWEGQDGPIKAGVDKVLGAIGLKDSSKIKRDEEWIGTPDNQIPLVRFAGMASAQSTLGRGQMDQIGALQRFANRKFTAAVEISIRTPDMNVFLPGRTPLEKYHNDVIYLDHNAQVGQSGGFVIQARPPEVLDGLLRHIEWADAMMDRIIGQPGPSRGEIPGTRTSGRVMQSAKQYASEIEGPEGSCFNIGLAATEKRIVLEGREVWPDKFKYQSIGESRQSEIREFETANLASVVDIQVAADDPWPTDRFQRWKVANEAFSSGVFGDPMDPKSRKKMEEVLKMPTNEEESRVEQFQNELIEQHMKQLKTDSDVGVSFACDDDYHINEEAQYLAELVADGQADEEYQTRVALHMVLHQLSKRRKEKWMKIGALTDKIASEISSVIRISNLAPEELAALTDLSAAEGAPGAPPTPGAEPEMPPAPPGMEPPPAGPEGMPAEAPAPPPPEMPGA